MTKREIAAVACRLLSLAMMGYGWVMLSKPVARRLLTRNSFVPEDVYVFPIVAGITWLIVSVVVWIRADGYAARMMPDDPEPVTSVDLKAEDVLSIGSGVIGMWIIGPALVHLSFLWNEIEFALKSDRGVEPLGWLNLLLPPFIPLAIGLWFMLGSRGLARFIGWARSAGTPTAQRSEVPEEPQP